MNSDNNNNESLSDIQARKKQAKKYELIHNILFAVDMVYSVILVVLFTFTGGQGGHSARLVEWIGSFAPNYWIQVACYLVILTTVYLILLLPISFYGGYYLEHKYQLSNETFFMWLKDKGKSYLLNLIFMVVFGEILYLFFTFTQESWWVWVGIIWVLFGIVLSNIAPVLIIPLFYKLKPLEDATLTQKLVALAERVNARILGVFEMELSAKTKKANAALAGLGNTKRILLGDTLLSNFNQDEIEVILAHELGHFYYKHMWKLIFFGGAVTFGGLYITSLVLNKVVIQTGFAGITDIAAFPLFILCMFAFALISMPITSTFSRILERQADLFALRETGRPNHFISSMKKLADLNLADENPHPIIEFLMHDHPSIAKRIKLAEQFALDHSS